MWRWRHVIPLRLRTVFSRDAVERELDEELRYHVERQIELNLERGMTPADARASALRAMGGLETHKEACRDHRGVAWIDHTLRDVRHGVRLLRRSPVFAVVAVCSLGIGIGVNAALFQLIDLVQLRSLSVSKPEELAEIKINGVRNFGTTDGFGSEITYPLWEQIRDHQQSFSGVFAWGRFRPIVGRGADAQWVSALLTSGDFFSVLGVAPERGRLLSSFDDRRGCGAGPVVLSHAFWQRYFGGQDSAIGSRLAILDHSFTVVGVTADGFAGLEVGRRFDLIFPICSVALWGNALDERHSFWLTVMGRLKPGWTIAKASDHLRALSPGFIEATVPSGYSAESTARYRAFRLGVWPAATGLSSLRMDYGTSLWLLFGMTGLVLLITCGNLATLMLARANAREREVTLRAALGASRARIVSQLLVESLLVAAMGAALSIPIALLSSRALVAFLSTPGNAIQLNLSPDWRMASFAGLVAVLTAILFGLVPALRLSHVAPGGVLRLSARGLTTDRRRSAFQRALVSTQIAMSLVLLVSALLFGRSFRNLVEVKTGFEQENILSLMFVDLKSETLPLGERVTFQQRLTDEVASTPGVAAAASSTHTPLNGASWGQGFRLTNTPTTRPKGAKFSYVGPEYFDTMRIPVITGRTFTKFDTAASQRVVVVNEAFVRTNLQGISPIGTTLRTLAEPGYPATTYEIVGIVGDTMYSHLREGMPPIAFVPIAQHPSLRPWASMLVRTEQPAPRMINAIKQRVAGLNPDIIVLAGELKGQIRQLMVRDRMLAWLAGAMSGLAVTLSAIGLYGLISYLAAGRRNEIGIRLSLGSTRGQVIGLMLRDGAWLVAAGLLVGLPLAFLVMRAVSSLLFGMPSHVVTLAAAATLLTAVAVVSGAIPAWRASRLDPTTVLRL